MGAGKPAPIESEFIPRFASAARSVGAGLARDGISAVIQLHRVDCIAGKPAPTESEFTPRFASTARPVGAGLARDGISAVTQLHRVDCIAGKPAPTESEFIPRFASTAGLWEPGLPAMASTRSFSCTALVASQASQLPPLLLQCFSYGCPPPDSPPTALACRFPSAHRVRSDD